MSQIQEILGMLKTAEESNDTTSSNLLLAKENADEIKERSAFLYGDGSQAVGRAEEVSVKINLVLEQVTAANAEIDSLLGLVAAMENA
jgi:hypothetical protein